jgi:hypothetical protein
VVGFWVGYAFIFGRTGGFVWEFCLERIRASGPEGLTLLGVVVPLK